MAFYHRVLGIAVLGSVSLLSGCGNFFQCEGKSDCPTTGGGGTTTTGNFVYVSNSPSGSSYISGYSLSSGTLTAIAGADKDLGFTPVAMVVAPKNGFLYVASAASATSPGVYVYSIDASGNLTTANSGQAFYTDDGIASMDISPDGAYLFTISNSNLGSILTEYPLNTTTGLPTAGTPPTFPTNGTNCSILQSALPYSQECTVKVSPNGDYVAVALGGYGFEVYPYSSSGGIPSTPAPQLSPSPSLQSADFSLAFDSSGYLYVSSTAALTSFGGIGGSAAPVQEQTVPYTAGVTPRSVTVASGYVYTANEGNSTISGYSLPGSGVMTSVGADVAGPASVSALGVDSTGKYLIAAGFNGTNGLQVFNITSSGTLTSTGSTEGTGTVTTIPVVMALSH
jgi:6-phosphogluconolactonase (cycloisomerase 2 family)